MALFLPTPETDRQRAADTLIRQIETTTPIVRGSPKLPWLNALMRARERPDVGLDVALCATSRILIALPEPNTSVRWSILALIADTPIGIFTGAFPNRTEHLQIQMQNLHQFATAATGYTLPQLQGKARELGDPFLNGTDSTQNLTLAQMTAYRAGYRFWRDTLG